MVYLKLLQVNLCCKVVYGELVILVKGIFIVNVEVKSIIEQDVYLFFFGKLCVKKELCFFVELK